MQRVTDFLDTQTKLHANAIAFSDDKRELSYAQLQHESHKLASLVLHTISSCQHTQQMDKKCQNENNEQHAVAVFLPKSIECIVAFLAVAYTGEYYTPLDIDMPTERIDKIMSSLEPALIITDKAHKDQALSFCGNAQVVLCEQASHSEIDQNALQFAKQRASATDLLYVMFTSGSTGMPKGVMVEHKAVIAYAKWMSQRFAIDSSAVLASQTPFYFVMSVFDIYVTLCAGACMHIVPKELFSFPVPLMQFLQEKHVNTLYWVPSALCAIATLGALDEVHLDDLKAVLFSGEVMPVKQLNKWMKQYPATLFANIYGQTEAMDASVYYVLNRSFGNAQTLPIGNAVGFAHLYVLDDTDTSSTTQGELCIAGEGLARGYLHDKKKTGDVFTQNPVPHAKFKRIYRTGDIVSYNEYGELVFVTRKDFQIKHMGNRIELGEIESAALSVEGVERACCLYNTKRKKIVLFYVGSISRQTLKEQLKTRLPDYMIPNKTRPIDAMPLNANGKIDRKALEAHK